MRLQKYLASQGVCSRSQGEVLIDQGRIFINGKIALLGDRVTGEEEITLDGKVLDQKKAIVQKVLVFHKPAGVDSTLAKITGACTLNDFDFGSDRVFPIGSLETETAGILLLTNNGELANKLSSTKSGLIQGYEANFKEDLRDDVSDKITEELAAMTFDDIFSVAVTGTRTLNIRTRMLRSKDLRKTLEKYGVIELCRDSLGPFSIVNVEEARFSTLSEQEYADLISLASEPV